MMQSIGREMSSDSSPYLVLPKLDGADVMAERKVGVHDGGSEVAEAALHFTVQAGSEASADGKSIDAYFSEPERLDTIEEVSEMELKSVARDFIVEWVVEHADMAADQLGAPTIQAADLNNQFIASMTTAMMNDRREVAYTELRSPQPQNRVHESAVELISGSFDDMYDELHDLLDNSWQSTKEAAAHRLEYTGDISWNDRYQFKNRERRSMEVLRNNGLAVNLSSAAVTEITRAYQSTEDSQLPILEIVKNKRLAEIGGFQDSKFSLLIHDYVDHYWTIDLLQRTGVMDRHSKLMDSIGNPENTDIFKREGEAIASISFGVRYHATMGEDFRPIIDTAQIANMMSGHAEAGRLQPEHQEALETVTNLAPESSEYQSLGFAYSNYVTELNEQRRKHGKIKTKDVETGQVAGELDPSGPEYLSFFIDAHHQLAQEENGYQEALVRSHAYVESTLRDIAWANLTEVEPAETQFVILPAEVEACEIDRLGFEPEELAWMQDNYGFMATKSITRQAVIKE